VEVVRICIHFYSYLKDVAGTAEATECVAPGSTLEDLLDVLFARLPNLSAMRSSILVAVGVDYQARSYILQEGDEVSVFPPVQGG
jgi:molybdopterin converting factor small subunit